MRRAVLGPAAPDGSPARLVGWRRVFVRGDTYPVVLPHPGGVVHGLLTPPLRAADAERLRRYEGPGYAERRLPVEPANADSTTALVFVPRDRAVATEREWDLGEWQARHQSGYLARHGLARASAARGRGPLDT